MSDGDLWIKLANEGYQHQFATLIRSFASGELKQEYLRSRSEVSVTPEDANVVMICDEARRPRSREVIRKGSGLIEWRMDKEGWLETAEKIENLSPNSHAYVEGEITITISLGESR